VRATPRRSEPSPREALLALPLSRVRDVDPVALGLASAAPYVPRDIDDDLRARLLDSSVVVSGPPGSGRSRTAFEAVRAAHADAEFAVPVDARALRELLERGLLGMYVVVWLDDAVRFDAVPAELWGPRRRAVVTSQPGAEPRGLPVFRLRGELSAAERARAQRLQPGVPFADHVPPPPDDEAALAEIRRLQESGADPEAVASELMKLAERQLQSGRHDPEALRASEEAVQVARRLAAADPRQRPLLADALELLATVLRAVGRKDEADAADREAEMLRHDDLPP
jgi:hypothetical protein